MSDATAKERDGAIGLPVDVMLIAAAFASAVLVLSQFLLELVQIGYSLSRGVAAESRLLRDCAVQPNRKKKRNGTDRQGFLQNFPLLSAASVA
jgi:hypothetical protein